MTAENTSSEPVRQFWHGTRRNCYAIVPCGQTRHLETGAEQNHANCLLKRTRHRPLSTITRNNQIRRTHSANYRIGNRRHPPQWFRNKVINRGGGCRRRQCVVL